VGARREFVIAQSGRVAHRAHVGKESLLIVGLASRPHSPRLQLGTFPFGTYTQSGTVPRPHSTIRITLIRDYGAGYNASRTAVADTAHPGSIVHPRPLEHGLNH
jgi:hypothetical protein